MFGIGGNGIFLVENKVVTVAGFPSFFYSFE